MGSRIFTMGCSMGSAFSEYMSSCIKADKPEVISAFATHSTGLKVKGDGNKFPKATLDRQYEWGECPTCQYFPFKPPEKPLVHFPACAPYLFHHWARKVPQSFFWGPKK